MFIIVKRQRRGASQLTQLLLQPLRESSMHRLRCVFAVLVYNLYTTARLQLCSALRRSVLYED